MGIYVNLDAGTGKTSGSRLLFLDVAEKLDAIEGPAHQVQGFLVRRSEGDGADSKGEKSKN